jgi:hypothetical protein
MATAIAMMIGGAITNAVAFSGSNYLFSLFHNREADKERIRHDKATEKYQKDHNEWVESRQKKIDFINNRENQARYGLIGMDNADDSLKLYHEVFGGSVESEPQFHDYYQPSKDQEYYHLITTVGGAVLSGIIIHKIFS